MSATPTTMEAADVPPPASSQERMARLRHLVRDEGKDVEEAARELGVDPIIAQLWLRLPDELWPTSEGPPKATSSNVVAPPLSSFSAGALASGLRRVLTCWIPAPAFDRLRLGERPVLEAASAALEAGLVLPPPEVESGGMRFARRALAVPITGEAYAAVLKLARKYFDDDPREAAGWLIARGIGMSLPLPTSEELAGVIALLTPKPVTERPALPPNRWVYPPRRRPEPRAPLPADDSAPSGEELAERRNSLGISQRDLAAAAGLSRGLVAEIERGRRRHVLTRLKLAETLAGLSEHSKGKAAYQEAVRAQEPAAHPPPLVQETDPAARMADVLFERRLALGLAQKDVAAEAKVSVSSVSAAENNKRNTSLVRRLLEAIDRLKEAREKV